MLVALEYKAEGNLFSKKKLDLPVELVPRHLANLDEGSVHALKLHGEKADVFLDALVQVVLIHEQLAQLGEQAAHGTRGDLHEQLSLAPIS